MCYKDRSKYSAANIMLINDLVKGEPLSESNLIACFIGDECSAQLHLFTCLCLLCRLLKFVYQYIFRTVVLFIAIQNAFNTAVCMLIAMDFGNYANH